MNALICIGCNTYDHLHPLLKGAEKDAQEVFGLLSIQNGFYDQEVSCVLLSPDTSTIKDALKRIFSTDEKIDVFTVKAGRNDNLVSRLGRVNCPLNRIVILRHPERMKLLRPDINHPIDHPAGSVIIQRQPTRN